nr:hypothetical protein [Tanacetum cinerariifolium]
MRLTVGARPKDVTKLHEFAEWKLKVGDGVLEEENKGSDSVDKTERNAAIDQSIFSPKFINGLKFSGVPNHRLLFKAGVRVMLLRNIGQPNGLCNGTRLQVLKLTRTSISAQIMNGTHFGKKVIIPRLKITPYDKRLPLMIFKKQFPLSVSFAMTINKSQGQSLSKVGLYQSHPVFTHGQLCVIFSRVIRKQLRRLAVEWKVPGRGLIKLQILSNTFDNDPRLLRSLCRFPCILDIIHQFYWDNITSHSNAGSKPLMPITNKDFGERPNKEETQKIHLLLLSIGEMSLTLLVVRSWGDYLRHDSEVVRQLGWEDGEVVGRFTLRSVDGFGCEDCGCEVDRVVRWGGREFGVAVGRSRGGLGRRGRVIVKSCVGSGRVIVKSCVGSGREMVWSWR